MVPKNDEIRTGWPPTGAANVGDVGKMGDFRQKAICTFLFLFQFILLSTDKWRTKRCILLIIIITITTSQKQYKTDKQFPLKKNRKLYLLNQTVTLPSATIMVTGQLRMRKITDCQFVDYSICRLDTSQTGQLVVWTGRGLVKLWIRTTRGLDDLWISLPPAFIILFNLPVSLADLGFFRVGWLWELERAKQASIEGVWAYGGGWRRGVVVSGVRRWTKLMHIGPGYYWDGWLSSGGYTISVCNKPTRSTQPCIPPGSLNWVPASAGVRVGMLPLPGGR